MPIRLTLKKIRYVAAALLLLLIGAGAGYFLGTREVSINPNNGPKYRIVNRLAPSGFEDIDFSLFWDVWDQVHKTYLKPEEINDKQLVYGAMKGMVSAIGDPYTVFLPPDDNEKVREDLSGQFEGVGMQLGFIDGQLAVMSPLEGMTF
jgi:carboxyl-terminal processing protease